MTRPPVCFHCHRPQDPAAFIFPLHICQPCARMIQDEYGIPLQSVAFADQFNRSSAFYRSKSETLAAHTLRSQVRILLLVANQAIREPLDYEREIAARLAPSFPELMAMPTAAPLSVPAPRVPPSVAGLEEYTDRKMAAAGKD